MRKHLRTVRLRILWEYAKLITCSRLDFDIGQSNPVPPDRRNEYWAIVNRTFNRLDEGNINPSTILRENKILISKNDTCAYCGCDGKLQWEHIIPKKQGGPDTINNMVMACSNCNQSKGTEDVRVWCQSRGVGVPRLVLGKYLKLLMEAHEENGSLECSTYPEGKEIGLKNLPHVFFELREMRKAADSEEDAGANRG